MVIASRSVLQCATLCFAVLVFLGLHALVKETAHLSEQELESAQFRHVSQLTDQEPDSTYFLQLRQPSQLLERPNVEIVRTRGHIQIKRSSLTEGPRLHPGKRNWDSIEAYFPHETNSASERYIVGWKPVVNEHKCPDGTPVQLVHHMNVLSVNPSSSSKTILEKVKAAKPFSRWDEGAKLHFVASYDRGAAEYRLPHGYGIPFRQLVLEYHLLIPECWDFSSQPIETSGIDLYVTSKRPERLAGLFGITDEDMDIKSGNGMVDHVTVLKPESLAKVFTKDALDRQFGSSSHLQLLAVHLHTHEISLSKSFEVLKPDGSVLFQSQQEKSGYGPQQSFLSPQEKGWTFSEIEPGQSYRVHCKFDKSKLRHRVVDGTSHGEEMCAALFVVGGPAAAFKAPLSTETMLSTNGGFFVLLGRALQSAFAGVKGDMQRLRLM